LRKLFTDIFRLPRSLRGTRIVALHLQVDQLFERALKLLQGLGILVEPGDFGWLRRAGESFNGFELLLELPEQFVHHFVYPFRIDVFGFDLAERRRNVFRFRVAHLKRSGYSAHVSTQLWGYSAIGDLTVTVQEALGFLQKKFQKKIRRAKLSHTLQHFGRRKTGKKFRACGISFVMTKHPNLSSPAERCAQQRDGKGNQDATPSRCSTAWVPFPSLLLGRG